ncbi:MAG: ABC transporter substrate-binding protein [Solobacterium sp.]|nr:ABC transporter substrate-binding protein [Solobacterium sp.]
MIKKITLGLFAVSLMLCGCQSGQPQSSGQEAEAQVRPFTDSLGRTVTLPETVTKVAVSGPLTQTYVFPLCPELLAGYSRAFASDVTKYIPEEYLSLPELGQLYGGKGTMDLEALLAAAPDVVIDVGDEKNGMAEELDDLSDQTGIPFVHINASVTTAADAYRRLGELTGKTGKAEELAQWCERTLAAMNSIMARADADGARKRIIYCLGDKGLNCMAEGSYHAETVNMMGDNAAKLDDVASSGAGNEIDFEQLLLWDPEVILFDVNSVYSAVGSDPAWTQLSAVKNGTYYEVPYGPYGWLSSPPSVQRYLGMLWLGALLYPEYAEYDLKTEVREYYRLFYGYELSDSDYEELTANAF